MRPLLLTLATTLTLGVALSPTRAHAEAPATAPQTSTAEETAAEKSAERPLRWTLQVDPLTTFLGYVHLQVERTLTDRVSLYVGPHARLFSTPGAEPEAHRGLGVELGVRWYAFGERGRAPRGGWLLLRGVGARVTLDDDSTLGGYVSALIGYTAIFNDLFVLSGGAGVQYLHYSIQGIGAQGVFPALHTTIGLAF